MALLLISHDLGVMADAVQRLMVMYGGTVVESGPTAEVFSRLAHPYTRGLFAARPRLGLARGTRLATIPGRVPELADMPPGCPFAERCPVSTPAVRARCRRAAGGPGHEVRCLRAGRRRDGGPRGPAGRDAAAGQVDDLAKHYRLPRRTPAGRRPWCRRWPA
jgi:peptide/nickel transport system ATP-binding protein